MVYQYVFKYIKIINVHWIIFNKYSILKHGGILLPSTNNDHGKDPKNSRSGFLKQRGYHPEPSAERDAPRPSKPSHEQDGLGHMPSISHQPRPEPILKEKETKAQARKSAQKTLHDQYTKYPELKRANKLRNGMVALAVLILFFSIIFSYQNYLSMTTTEPSLPEQGYNFMHDLRNYEHLSSDNDMSFHGWDANKFLIVTSEQINTDLKVNFNFIIEVFDLSTYQIRYNRTIQNNLAWSNHDQPGSISISNEQQFEISSHINIIVSPKEVHLVRIKLTIRE